MEAKSDGTHTHKTGRAGRGTNGTTKRTSHRAAVMTTGNGRLGGAAVTPVFC